MTRLQRYYSLGFVMVTGAVVMGLEVLGTRVIGTVYGSSLFVWGALLTTTLVCLAAGYAIGGSIADRWPHDWLLYLLTMLAGGASLTIPATQAILEPCFRMFGPRAGALVSAFAIFTLPLALLGMASPFVVRLQARNIKAMGKTAGAVFALSTAGSVAGTLLISFYLIPELGTRWSLVVEGCALMLIGAGGLAVSFGPRALPALLAASLAWFAARGGPPASEEVLYRTESPYGRLAVVQPKVEGPGGYRMLFSNGVMQTGMPVDMDHRDRTSLLRAHSYYLELLPYFHDDPDAPRTALLIGLAGGMFARVMELYPVDLTAVEIDVKVAELAKAYFDYGGRILYPDGREHVVDLGRFPRRRLGAWPAVDADADANAGEPAARRDAGCVYIQDGRRFLRSSARRYDFIVLDAYNSDTIPFHLITREMFAAARKHLTDDGILAINYIGAPAGDEVTHSLARTLADVFGPEHVIAYRSTDDPEAVQVIYFFVFRGEPSEPTLPAGRWASDEPGQVDPLAYELLSRRLKLSFTRGRIITDDHNPIDVARIKTALDWRRQTFRQFGHLKLHRF